jgi:hypothetical protein
MSIYFQYIFFKTAVQINFQDFENDFPFINSSLIFHFCDSKFEYDCCYRYNNRYQFHIILINLIHNLLLQ